MNFSFSLFLVSLSFPFVSCEECFEVLHETFKRDFDDIENCNECVVLSPETTFRGEYWSGFCTGGQSFLFPDWKCRTDDDLLEPIGPFALVTKELCELRRNSRDLDETCLKMYNEKKCKEGSVRTRLEVKESDEHFTSLTVFEGHTRGTRTTTVTSTTEKTISKTNITKETDTTTTTKSTATEETTTKRKTISIETPVPIKTTTEKKTTTTSLPWSTTRNTTSATTWSTTLFPTTASSWSTTLFPTTASSWSTTRTTTSTTPWFTTASSTTTSYPIKKTCERKEFFFENHCYFLKNISKNPNISISDLTKGSTVRFCQSQHPKSLGLAIETREENHFIMKILERWYYFPTIYVTSGVRQKGFPDEWEGWNLKINNSILEPKTVNSASDILFYLIDTRPPSRWIISTLEEWKFMQFLVVCERPYNPKNVVLELHERCLQLYRNSSCGRFQTHTNYCCEKDETGEIWFACSGHSHVKIYPNEIKCHWMCDAEGFFDKDRPSCVGPTQCTDSYDKIMYHAPPTKFAIGGCPENRYGFSTWLCGSNKKFVKKPDYSLCCESKTPHCRDTDVFLNIWMACPSLTVSKRTTCPPGYALQEADVKWHCQENGTFLGNTPDYTNCNATDLMCRSTDNYGREWTAMAGTTEQKGCPPDFSGHCFWKCKLSGKFDGSQPDCSNCKARWMEDVADKIKNETNYEDVMEIMEHHTKVGDLSVGYGHVLNLTDACVHLYKNQNSNVQFCVFEKFLNSYSKILKNVAGDPNLWSSFSEPNKRGFTDKIFETTQTAAFANLESLNGTCQHYNQTFANSDEDGFDFFVAYNPSVGSRFPLENFSESDWHLDIKELRENNTSYAAMGLVMNYSLTTVMFLQGNETEDLVINAPAVTFTVAASKNGEVVLDPNVVVSVSFKHVNKTRSPATSVIRRRLHEGEQPSGQLNSTLCYYYRDSDWSTDGCSVTYSTKEQTNCTCTHLSTIGLLMSVHKYEPNLTMEIMSTVNSGITIISLILALLVFFFVDKAGNERVLIGKNLCFCLLIGHVLLLTVMDKKFFNIPDSFCTVYAVLLHYVFMAAFAWMFVEGWHLYRMLILVFDSNIEYRLIYLVIGYGMPLVIVAATYGVGFILQEQPYGQDELCWLKTPDYVWAFVGPVILLTSINFCILIMAMKSTAASRRKTEKSSSLSLVLWKGWISLSALLGITWLLGLAYITYNEPLMYVFIFCNGLQGFFIFIFRCVLCEQYKSVILKKLKSWFSKSKFKYEKKIENVRSDTKLFAISGTKSLTESKDSGYDLEIEDRQKCLKKSKVEKPDNSSSGVEADISLSPAASEAYLRNVMIARNFSARESKAKWLSESDNFPELSFHDIPN